MEKSLICDRRLFVRGFTALVGGAVVAPVPVSAGSTKSATDATKDAAFCIAYQMRDGEEGDVKPEAESVLLENGLLDVATFATRIVAQAKLTDSQARKVADAVANGKGQKEKMVCYMPHHLFIYYSKEGRPLGCIEVCFICSQVHTAGPVPVAKAPNIFVESADLEAIRDVLVEAKLPLSPKSVDSGEKNGEGEGREKKK